MATSKSKAAIEKKPATGKSTAKASPPAAKKPAAKASAKPATAASAAKKPSKAAAKVNPSPEERYRMVQEAAYFMAEKESFAGCSADYWIKAESQIEAMLSGR